jgi:hypothetical protein
VIKSLQKLLSSYPTPLRNDLLEGLFLLAKQTLPNDPANIYLQATRRLQSIKQEEFVDKLKEANDLFTTAIKSSNVDKDAIGQVYADWLDEWVNKIDEENLVGPMVIF